MTVAKLASSVKTQVECDEWYRSDDTDGGKWCWRDNANNGEWGWSDDADIWWAMMPDQEVWQLTSQDSWEIYCH